MRLSKLKKVFAVICVFILLFCGAQFGYASYSSNILLSIGDYGPEVVQLQEELYLLNLFFGNATGVYDSATADAVMSLQKMLGTRPDGIFGPATMTAYKKAIAGGILKLPTVTNANLLLLYGRTIGIDPGHQAREDNALEKIAPLSEREKERQSVGCVGIKTGTPEYKITLEVALKLKDMLEFLGANVILTRTTSNVSMSNVERAEMMNDFEVDMWVRVHCDSSTSQKKQGASVLAPGRFFTPAIYKESLRLGNTILEQFCISTEANALNVVQVSDQTGFNWSLSPVVAIEMGFLSNAQEDLKLNRDSYQYLCASGICNGIVAYFRVD